MSVKMFLATLVWASTLALMLSGCGSAVAPGSAGASAVAVAPSVAASRAPEAAPSESPAASITANSGSGVAADGAVPPALGGGMCVETYSSETLRNRAFAFDGTITAIEQRNDPAIDDGQSADVPKTPWVTFAVNRWYKGGTAQTIGIWVPGLSGGGGTGAVLSTGGLSGDVGTRLLVAGEEIGVGADPTQLIAWNCGFSQPYTPEAAAAWETSVGQ